jgi:signal transduction histidine kinase
MLPFVGKFRMTQPRSLRSSLVLLVAIAFIPFLAFAVIMVILSARSQREVFERGARERTRALITAVDAELKSATNTLEALATSWQLDHDELSGFYDEALRVLKSQVGWRTVILSTPGGASLLNLLTPLGTELGPVVETRSFNQVLKTVRPAVGDIQLGPLTHTYDFSIRVPVVRNAQIKYVLSAVITPRVIDDLLSPQRLPEKWIGVVLDNNRRFVSRTVEPQGSVGQIASESLRAALDHSPEGWFRGTTVEGWAVYTPYTWSSFSGWTVAMGIPADVVDAASRRSMLYLVLLGSGLLALSLVIAWYLSDRIASSMRSLASLAQHVGSGRSPTPHVSSSGIAEVDDVRDAFMTADRLLQQESAEKERIAVRLQLALNAGNVGVHEWDPRTKELIWDDRVRAHWGLSPGKPVTFELFVQGLHPGDRVKLRTALKRALDPASDGQYHAEFRVIGIEDHVERWIEARGHVLFVDGQPIRLTGTTIDISDRKAFQTELERLVQERTAQLHETIAELEAFSYSVSHDMRAPLRAMEGYARALVADYQDRLDMQGRHWLERITRSAHRLDALVQDVLAYSRVSKGEIGLTAIELEKLIDDIIAANPEFQTPSARVVLKRPLDPVLGHEAYLTQCVTNLLANGVKFVREGMLPEILIWSERRQGKIRVWFEDNGVGIDPAHHERIFEIFGQVYPAGRYSGTGIGLAIVRKAVQRMNGNVGVESELGGGSRFWVDLSRVDANPSQTDSTGRRQQTAFS